MKTQDKPPVGIEPTTIRLRSACSTNWAKEALDSVSICNLVQTIVNPYCARFQSIRKRNIASKMMKLFCAHWHCFANTDLPHSSLWQSNQRARRQDSRANAFRLVNHKARKWINEMTAVGFEPTPLRTGALSQRLRPLGQTVLSIHPFHNDYGFWGNKGKRKPTKKHCD